MPSCSSVWDRTRRKQVTEATGKRLISHEHQGQRHVAERSQLHHGGHWCGKALRWPKLKAHLHSLNPTLGKEGVKGRRVYRCEIPIPAASGSESKLGTVSSSESHFKIWFYLTICHFTPTSEASCLNCKNLLSSIYTPTETSRGNLNTFLKLFLLCQ